MNIIPAIDIIDKKCVRLTQGDYLRVKKYGLDPVDIASEFREKGAPFLHVVDLDGAKSGRILNKDIVIKIAKTTGLPIQVGGGIRNFRDVAELLGSGVDKVILGTSAVEKDGLVNKIIKQYGAERLVVAVDVKNNQIMSQGWQSPSRVTSDMFLRMIKKAGVRYVLATDIEKDGTLSGPNFGLIKKIVGKDLKVIAAGGITTMSDLKKLDKLGIYGAIIGKALYENKLNLKEAINYFSKNNLSKRIIPCLDIKNSRVVKGTCFKNLLDVGDPVEIGESYSKAGADELVFLDISATTDGRRTLAKLVSKIAKNVNIPFTVGGGISSVNDVQRLLYAGADKISIGTIAVKNPRLIKEISKKFGSQCIVVSIDAKKHGNNWRVCINSGSRITKVDAVEFAKLMEKNGAGELLVNSLDRDGTEKGFDIELLSQISMAVNIPVIASSGAGTKKDFLHVFEKTNVDAVLAASVFHYGKINIKELKKYLGNNKIPMRI